MIFRDTQLQECYDSHFINASDPTGDLRRVRALIAAHDLFQMLEGAHSTRVHEAIDHLVSSELRSGLRQWFQRADAETDSAALEFRDQLNQLTGERLERPAHILQRPS